MLFEKKFKIATLEELPHKLDETIKLIERGFNYPDGQSFAIDFSPLINESNFQNNHIIIDHINDKVVAHIGVVLRYLGNTRFQLKTALLGGIVIDEEYRAQGIFTHLMKYVLQEYSEDAGLFMLWSDLNILYEKFFFYQAGGQIQLGTNDIDEKLKDHFQKTKLFLLSNKELKQIKNIYNNETYKNYTTISRNEMDWQAIQKISSTDLYLKKNNDGDIVSYFFTHKGNDLQNIIHEVGYLHEYKDWTIDILKDYKLWLPEQEKLFFNYHQIIYMALMKIGKQEYFNSFLRKWSQNELFIESITNGYVTFKYKSEQYNESIPQFLAFIFGPSPLKEFEKYGPPLYLSGLDSI